MPLTRHASCQYFLNCRLVCLCPNFHYCIIFPQNPPPPTVRFVMDIPGVPAEEVEEVLKLLEAYERSGRGFGEMPEDLQGILNKVKRAKGQPSDEESTQDITPQPGFVVKTTDEHGGKVFVNICHSTKVPAPGGWQNGRMPDNVLRALDDLQRDQPQADAEALRFPLSCSEVSQDTDKQGQPCSTIDCIIHSDVLAAAQQHRPLKAFLIELALQWVSSKHKMQLNPKFKLPKMSYKGTLVRPQRVRMDKKPLVLDVTAERDEEPSFPLVPVKAAPKSSAAQPIPATTAVAVQPAAECGQLSSGTAVGQQFASVSPAEANPAFPSSSSSSWPYELQIEGRPVTHMIVTVQLPDTLGSRATSTLKASDIRAEVCGRQLRIAVQEPARTASAGDFVLQMPFAADSSGSLVELQSTGKLQIQLAYLPCDLWVKQLVAEAPHAFTQLPVSHASYMELDDLA